MPTIRQRNGRFQAQVRIKQDGVIVHQESATWDTYKQAQLWGLSLERKIAVEGVANRPTDLCSVKQMIEQHEKTLVKVNRGIRGFQGSLKSLKESSFADKGVGRLTTSDISKWAISRAEHDAPATILHRLMTLRSAFITARTVHGLKVDVTVVGDAVTQLMKLGVAAKSKEVDRRVSDEEINAIATCYEKLDSTHFPMRLILNLAVALPRRRGELMTMRWEDYDGEQITLFNTKDPTKERDETIPMPPAAKALLDTLKRKPEGVILPYKPKSLGNAFTIAAKAAGVSGIRFHDLRHEGVSRLFEMGLDIPEVSLISGHVSWATLKRYTHLKPKTVLEKMNASRQRAQEIAAQSEGT